MPTSTDPTRRLKALIDRCRDDPGLFNVAILARPPYWWRQEEVCRSVVRHRTTVVAAGNSVGKSFLAAGIVWWWLLTRPGALVIATAPSQALLGTVLFKEIRRAFRCAAERGVPLGGRITDSPSASPQVVDLGDGRRAIGIATRGVERLSGQHAAHLLALVDEASGVEGEIWEAIASLNPERLLVLGNPLSPEGRFPELFARGERDSLDPTVSCAERVDAIRIPSTDSPDRDLPRSPRGLADRGWLDESRRAWGEESLWWLTHVQARFPKTSHDALMPAEWISQALGRYRDGQPPCRCRFDQRAMGVDIARGTGRDRAAIAVRCRCRLRALLASPWVDVPELARIIDMLARQWSIPTHRIVYDASNDGRDLPRYLAPYGLDWAIPYHGSGEGDLRHANARSLVAWRLRRWLDPRGLQADRARDTNIWGTPLADRGSTIYLPAQPFGLWPEIGVEHVGSLEEELKSLRYSLKSSASGSKVALEPKDELQQRLGRSPDLADALLMSLHVETDWS